MKLTIAKDDGQVVEVAITGRVTQTDFGPIHEPLAQLLGPNTYARTIRLDLSDTDYLDSSGVSWLLTCHKRMREAGGKLSIHNPHPTVANVLRVLRLEKVLDVELSNGAPPPSMGGRA